MVRSIAACVKMAHVGDSFLIHKLLKLFYFSGSHEKLEVKRVTSVISLLWGNWYLLVLDYSIDCFIFHIYLFLSVNVNWLMLYF